MLHVRLLGEQVIADDGGAVRTRSSRTIALLALLVLHAGLPQTRHRIAASFWPDSSDEQALTNLRRELHHLRAVLGDDESLVVTARDLSWRDTATCRVDVREFARHHAAALAAAASGDGAGLLAHATAAVEVYQGELLPGGYDDWLLAARAELEQQCVELLDLICDARAAAGAPAAAAEAVRHRIRIRPLDEVGHRRLIELLGELGDRAGAVSTYHHCAAILERELGVDPDPATRAALNRLLARAAPPDAPPPEPEAPRARSGPAGSPLVGRSVERDVLWSAWQHAAAGHPGIAVVRGEAGVGKTRLVDEIAEAARAGGAVVATARCFGTSGRLALSPVADWLRAPDVQAGLGGLEPVWREEVDRLAPSETARADPRAGSRAMVDAWQRHRFFEGLARALVVSGRPTLLVLDNLHWSDPETLAFLAFCLGLAPDAPLLVVATARADAADPEQVEWAAGMRAAGMLSETVLEPLDVAAAARLGEAFAGRPLDRVEAELLHAMTGGFPLHVIEAARAGVDLADRSAATDGLMSVLRGRIEQVTPDAREVAGLAAAVGRDFTLDLLVEASDLDADTVVRAVDELWRRRIVRELGDGYDFSHDLLRDAAYALVARPRRRLLHLRVAEALELLHDGAPDTVAAQLAEQYASGGRPLRAAEFYRRAADVAAHTFAHAEAVRLHRAVLAIIRELPEGPDRDARELAALEAMAAPLNALGGYSSPELREPLERSIELAERLGRPEATLAGLVNLWSSNFVRGNNAAAHRTATRAMALARRGSAFAGQAHFAFGGSTLSLGRPAEGLTHLQTAAEGGGTFSLSTGTRTDVHALSFAAHAHWLLGHDAEAEATARKAIALARSVGHPYVLAVALAYAGITRQLRGDLAALETTVAELRDLCERHGFAYYREWGMVLGGWARGDTAGVDLARRGIEDLTAAGSLARMPYWLSLLALLSERTGDRDAARGTLDEAVEVARTHDDLWWMPEVMRLRAGHDDPPAAVERLRAAAALAAEQGSVALVRRCTADLTALGEQVEDPVAAPEG